MCRVRLLVLAVIMLVMMMGSALTASAQMMPGRQLAGPGNKSGTPRSPDGRISGGGDGALTTRLRPNIRTGT